MRPPSCICGDCKKCKHRKYARDWYSKNRERVLFLQKKRRESGELAEYERNRYTNDEDFRKRKKARNMVSIRIARGTIKRENCQVCGAENAHAHHSDYNNPLDIVWLCASHHYDEHMKGRVGV